MLEHIEVRKGSKKGAGLIFKKVQDIYLVRDGFVWNKTLIERTVERPLALHGTSTVLLEDIMKKGLRTHLPFFSDVDISIYREFFGPQSIPVERAISLTTDPAVAIRFAKSGPAILLAMREKMQNYLMLNDEFPSTPEGKRIESLYNALTKFYKVHRPVVLLIAYDDYPNPDGNIGVLRALEEFPRIFDGLDQRDCSIWKNLRSLRRMGLKKPDRFQYVIRDSWHHCGGTFDLECKMSLIHPHMIKDVVKI